MASSIYYANILNEVKHTQTYKRLTTRQFKRKRGYKDFADIMRYPALFLNNAKHLEVSVLQEQDFSHYMNSCWLMLQDSNFPVYAPSRELIESLLQTDISEDVIIQLKQPFQQAIFVLPEGMFVDETGSAVNWFHCSWFDLESYEEIFSSKEYQWFLKSVFANENIIFDFQGKFESNEKYRLRWMSFCPDQSGYQSCFGLSHTGKILHNDVFYCEELIDKDYLTVIKNFTSRITVLMLQLCMFMQTPKYEQQLALVKSGDRHNSTSESNVREYISVDIPHSYISAKNNYQRGTHASPVTHWRRGHWRNAWVGEKKQEQRLIWIAPTIVNPS